MKATVNGSMITVEYHEPTTSKQGAVTLDDLAYTSIYVNGKKIRDVQATALTGGGTITESFDTGSQPGQEQDFSITLTATDLAVPSNESVHSAAMVIRIDMLAPDAPF